MYLGGGENGFLSLGTGDVLEWGPRGALGAGYTFDKAFG